MACSSRSCALVKHQKEISTAIISCLPYIFLWSLLLTTTATKESVSQIYFFCEHNVVQSATSTVCNLHSLQYSQPATSSKLVVPMAADRWRCFLSKSVNKLHCPVSSQGNSETFCKQMQWPFAQRQKWRLKFNEAFRGGYWEQRRRTGQGELGRSAQITCCENTINCYLDADWAKCY